MPRGRKPTHAHTPTLGGQKIRALRERAGKTLLELESTPDVKLKISAAHLHKIEVGDIKHPDFETLTSLLTALEARFVDRRAVLEAFGYHVRRSLPTEQEIEDARGLCSHELHGATFPMLLIDDGQRVLAWNRYAPRLLGMRPDDPALAQFIGVTTIDLALNPRYSTSTLLANPEEFVPGLLYGIKTGLHAFQAEPWYADLLAKAWALPGFRDSWEHIHGPVLERGATHPIIPLKIAVPTAGLLQFRVMNHPFILDPRFQLIPFIPYGATTLRQCAVWAEEEGVV